MAAPPALEFDLIDAHFKRVGAHRDDLLLGPGDDAALLDTAGPPRIGTASLEGAAALMDAAQVAECVTRACAALNTATACWATLSLTLPSPDSQLVQRFAAHLDSALRARGVALAGGDTTRGPARAVLMVIGV